MNTDLPPETDLAFIDAFQTHQVKHSLTGHRIKIYEMSHIAPAAFYAERLAQWQADAANGFVLHFEGVKRSKRNKKSMLMDLYGRLAELLGWELQTVPKGLPIENHDVKQSQLSAIARIYLFLAAKLLKSFIEHLEEIDPETRKKQLAHFKRGVLSNNKKPFLFGKALLTKRNAVALKAATSDVRPVALVWGKEHAKGMLEQLTKAGYNYETG